MPSPKTPDNRLLSAIPYLRAGGVVADIGTDHAYLPIELCRRGICRRAVACDINEGPISAARANIRAAGLSDRIDTLCTDGLHGVEPYAPDDILIFGMGGELIVRILCEAPWVRNDRIGLILQPMSRAEILRRYLWENGFEIRGKRSREPTACIRPSMPATREKRRPLTKRNCLSDGTNFCSPHRLREIFCGRKSRC